MSGSFIGISSNESYIMDGSDAAPSRLRCGPFGTIYTVLGNLHFNILLAASILFGPIWLAASLGDAKTLPAFFTSLAIGAVVLARRFITNKTPLTALVLNLALIILLSITILPFFLAVGPVVRANHRPTYDQSLANFDRALLGWLYPEGQMCLALDRSSSLNPSTPFGRFYTEVLQIFYVTYYLWGYLPLLILGYRYVLAWRKEDGNTVNRSLAHCKLYLTGWLTAFLLVFICNTSLPAKSPRLYFAPFQHPLEGFGLAKWLNSAAKDDTSFGSFPSGHFGESVVSGIYLLRVHKPLGILVIVSSAMIGIATQALRYHYFADLLGAAIVVITSLAFGFSLTSRKFNRETTRIIATYNAQTGAEAVFSDESNSTELALRSDDGSAGEIDFDNNITDLEAGISSDLSSNPFVHAII